MNTYDKDAACQKCGSKEINNIHRHRLNHRNYSTLCGMGPDDEHIERRCRNCKFEWYELPLDAAQADREAAMPEEMIDD